MLRGDFNAPDFDDSTSLGTEGGHEVLRRGPLALDLASLGATLEGRPLKLTLFELVLLRALLEAGERAVSRDELLRLAPGVGEDLRGRTIDVRVSRLRKKLAERGHPDLLRTVRHEGYLLQSVQ
jgi:two-component system OmpR family response regulator